MSRGNPASEPDHNPYGYTLGFAYCNLVNGFCVGVFPRFSFFLSRFFFDRNVFLAVAQNETIISYMDGQ